MSVCFIYKLCGIIHDRYWWYSDVSYKCDSEFYENYSRMLTPYIWGISSINHIFVINNFLNMSFVYFMSFPCILLLLSPFPPSFFPVIISFLLFLNPSSLLFHLYPLLPRYFPYSLSNLIQLFLASITSNTYHYFSLLALQPFVFIYKWNLSIFFYNNSEF